MAIVKEQIGRPVEVDNPNKITTPKSIDAGLDYKAPETKPVTTEVDAPNETVEGRMSNINLRDSAYSTLNEKEAVRESNDRGLINSTMAGAAGVEAGIKAARTATTVK